MLLRKTAFMCKKAIGVGDGHLRTGEEVERKDEEK
jgi:hypothetical protein